MTRLPGFGMATELKITDDFPPVTKDGWRAKAEKDLKGTPLEKLVARTIEGLDVEPLYALEDAVPPDARGFPGMAPYVRGRDAVERAVAGWQVCQEHDHAGVEASADAIERDLQRGAGAVWVRLGLAQGTRVLTIGDLDRLLQSVDLSEVRVYLDPGPDALSLGAALVGLARRRGVEPDRLRGGLGVDPLGTMAREGTLSSGVEGTFAEAADVVAWCREHAPDLHPLTVSTVPYHAAGATAVQELAWGVGTGVEYLRRMAERDLPVDEVAPRILFRMPVAGDFFMEIAKLRAARWVWSKAVAALGGGDQARSMTLHARTSPWTKARRDPWVNMIRATAESFAAAVGGADAVSTSAFDEAIGPSDEFARRVARNTQLVLREEGHLHRVIDPAGGSWYVESLTERLARAAWEELRSLERAGGFARHLLRGKTLAAVEDTAGRRRRDIATRKAPFVGVSEYPDLNEKSVSRSPAQAADEAPIGRGLREGDDGARRDALQKLADLTTGRREPAAGDLFAETANAAAEGVDLFSLGAVLRWGKASRHIEPLRPWRAMQAWEALRDASDKYFEGHGRRPRAFLANLGPIPEHRARSDYAHNLFAAGGIEPVTNDGFETGEEAARAFSDAEADMAVICGSDERYAEMVPALAAELKDRGAEAVVLAGRPGDRESAFREAGVDRFVHIGADVLGVLQELHRELGVKA